MRRGLSSEVLLKSFGNGVAMLRFQRDQAPAEVATFVDSLGIEAQEFVIGEPATDVFLMLEEGHPVTDLDVRNTEDEWESLTAAVQSGGSEGFRKRVAGLEHDRKSLTSPPS